MTEERRELKIRIKLCHMSQRQREWVPEKTPRGREIQAEMRRHQLGFEHEVGFGWMLKGDRGEERMAGLLSPRRITWSSLKASAAGRAFSECLKSTAHLLFLCSLWRVPLRDEWKLQLHEP